LAELIVRVSDLVEAEGRTLLSTLRAEGMWVRGYLARMGIGVVLLVAASVLVVAGCGLICASCFLWVQPLLGSAAAAGITGAVTLLLGILSSWIFYRIARV